MTLAGDLDVSVEPGEVAFAFTVRNDGTDPLTLQFRSGQTAEFVVYEDRTEVFRWSDGQMFTQALQTVPLGQDESVIYTGTWPDPETGTFKVVATLEAENQDLETSAEFYVY